MANDSKATRRDFVAATGALLGAAPFLSLRAQAPPSDRVRVGILGFGIRGYQLFRALERVPAAEVAAVADLYDGCLEHARELTGGKAETTKDYRRILDRKDIDAVVVATPDHWHAPVMTAAAQAGKDVYAEKPLTHRWEEGAPLLQAFRENKRVVQVGSGRVTLPLYQKAREIVQSGRLGRIVSVISWWDSGSSIYSWQYPIPPDASPETIDWKAFLGPAPQREFDPARFFRWRCFWDYGGGLPADLWTHHFTAIQWITGAKLPRSVVCGGAIYRWKDGREVPDTMSAFYDYPEGFGVSISSTKVNGSRDQEFQFQGTDATLVISRNELIVYPEPQEEPYSYVVQAWPNKPRELFYVVHGMDRSGQPRQSPKPREAEERYALPARPGFGGAEHMQDFINCVRTRQSPQETAEMGNHAALAAHMANLSYQHRAMVTWDDTQQRPRW